MTNQVRDRSGLGLPPKAERRALGKAAAEKRRRQRRNKQIRDRALQILAPIAVVVIIIGAVWLFKGGSDDNPGSTTGDTASTSWMQDTFDPQLATEPAAPTVPADAFSELKVTTLIQGTGSPVASGHSVTVNYVGISRTTGQEFDSSWSRNEPFTFTIGQGGVIAGWDQGLIGVPVGSRVELDIPSALAYGDSGQVPGDLIFIVDVLQTQ